MSRTDTLEEVQGASERRLYPPLTDPNWLVLRKRRDLFRNWINNKIGAVRLVLDVGGRLQPYRVLFPEQTHYLSVDLLGSPLVNVVADAAYLPFSDATVPAIVCTQMLEYAPEPSQVISEIYRVLEDGGWLLLSVPATFPRDSDNDAWRFLPAGIRHLLSLFEEVEVIPEGGSVAGLFRTLNVYLYLLARYSALRAVFKYTLVPALNVVGHLLEIFIASHNDQFAVNYSVLARKGLCTSESLNRLVPAV
jgi:SAM-dependent methyltransferase